MPSGVDGGHRYGDDARVRSRAPLARSDLRFARPVCATGTFEINGSRSSGACVSSERHRRRVGRSLLAQLISAPDRANSLPEAGGAYAKGPRPQSVTAVPPLARSTSLLKASPHTCIRARTSIPCQRRRRGCVCPKAVAVDAATTAGRWLVWSPSSRAVGDLSATGDQGLEPEAGSCPAGSNRKRRAHPAARS